MNHPDHPNRVHYRERSTKPAFKKQRVLSVRVDDEAFEKLNLLRKTLASRIGVREITMSAALAYCITTASA
ncbi:hypothetical protein V1282_005276 [Nitrobacteraceae bacterium AZCC 2146]